MAGKGKQLIPIPKNPVYSEILFRINTRKVYSFKFYEEFENKVRTTILTHLNFLYNQGYLNKEEGESRGKQLFSINWSKIIREFVEFLKERKKQFIEEGKELLGEKGFNKLIKNHTEKYRYDYLSSLDSAKFCKDLESNEYLLIFFKTIFLELSKYPNKFTLQYVFESIMNRNKSMYDAVMLIQNTIVDQTFTELKPYLNENKELMEKVRDSEPKDIPKKELKEYIKLISTPITIRSRYIKKLEENKDYLNFSRLGDIKNFISDNVIFINASDTAKLEIYSKLLEDYRKRVYNKKEIKDLKNKLKKK